MGKTQRQPCGFCHGSGQVSFFQGVSRFLLSVEECPECGGLGVVPEPEPERSGDRLEEETGRDRGKAAARKKR